MKSPVRNVIRSLIVACAAALWLLPASTAAQALYGSVTGVVEDTSGAAVPGATVTITTQETGLELTAVSDETGSYTVRNVPGGTYTLKATLEGFKEFVQTGIPVTVGNGQQVLRVVNEKTVDRSDLQEDSSGDDEIKCSIRIHASGLPETFTQPIQTPDRTLAG